MSARTIGPYEIVRELGRGGMGVVLEVRHPDLPRRLALKLISKEAAEGTALERFSREARLLARVKHPNVVSVHTFASTSDGRPYLVTDLVEGTNLKQLARSAPFDPARAAQVLQPLCSAVSALHAAGILHRDLKPENVILQPDDTPVLLDFGLAREHDAQRLTQTGTVLGTPAYMSPEQAGGDSPDTIDARCDVYGLGTILFELLAGRPPFEGTPIQIVTAVLRRDPRWPSEDRDDVPADLEAVLRKAMAKEAAARYANAAELGKDLARFAGGERVAAPRPATGSGRLVALVAAGVVGVLGAIGVALAMRSSRDQAVEAIVPVESTRGPSPAPLERFGPEPPRVEGQPVTNYRGWLRWLDDHANEQHPSRPTIKGLLERARERPLLSVPCPLAEEKQIIPRFVSDAQLAVLIYAAEVYVLDVDRGREFTPRWSANNVRLWNLAAAGSNLVISGTNEVGYARLAPTATVPQPVELFGPFASEAPFPGTQGRLEALAISGDGSRVVVGGDWPFAVLYDFSTGSPVELRRLEGFTNSANVCAFSPDGRRLVVGTIGGKATGHTAEVTLWSSDGEPLGGAAHLDTVHGEVCSIVFGPDERLFVSTTFGPFAQAGLDALELEPFQLAPDVALGSPTAFPRLAFVPGPQPRLYGLTKTPPVRLFEWRFIGNEVVNVRQVDRQQRGVSSIAVSPDGTILAIGGDLDGGARGVELWAVQSR